MSESHFYGPMSCCQVPPEIVSSNEVLLVRFKSDDTINSKGFSAAYVAIDETDNEDLPKSQRNVRYY